eukprot:4936869-Pyramimonas_sp.AAC.2
MLGNNQHGHGCETFSSIRTLHERFMFHLRGAVVSWSTGRIAGAGAGGAAGGAGGGVPVGGDGAPEVPGGAARPRPPAAGGQGM